MWSHYADKHKGICIGMSFEPASDYYFIIPVNYILEFDPPDFINDYINSLTYWYSTKYKKWSYEKEYRIINHKGGDIANLEQAAIKEVIFGCKVDSRIVNEKVKQLFEKKYNKTLFSRMEMSKNKFSLVEKKLSKPSS